MEVQNPRHAVAAAMCCSVHSLEAQVEPLNTAIVLKAEANCQGATEAARIQCNSTEPKLKYPVLPIHLTQYITFPKYELILSGSSMCL